MRTHRLVVGSLVMALLVPSAYADDPTEPMEDYFAGEVRGGMWLLGMGAAGIASGGYLTTRDTDYSTGMSYPLIGVGVVHAAAGVFVIVSSKRRVTKFKRQIDDDPGKFVDAEYDRIGGVKKQFFVLKIVETALIAGGVGLAIYGEREDRPTLTGVGVGLAVEAGATLLFDIVASRRAGRYRKALNGLRVTVQPDGDGGHTLGAGFSTAF